MGATYVHDLAPFLFQPGVKNLRDTKTQYFNGDWRFHSNWGLHSGYTHFNQTNGAAITKFLNREEHIFDFGVNFYATDINKVGVLFRRTWGDFPASSVLAPDGVAADNSFDQNEVRAVVDWFFSGKSWVQFSGGWVERKNATFSSNDFNGFNARVIYILRPTAKTAMALSGWRETGPVNAINARFSLNTGVSFAPSWDITEKIKLQGEVLYENREFNGFAGGAGTALVARKTDNKVFDGSLGLVYKPYTGIQVSALAYHKQLTIDDAALGDMTANGASITIRYTFNDYDSK